VHAAYRVEDLATTMTGVIADPEQDWERFAQATAEQMGHDLLLLARQVELGTLAK
jgi:hypothetical protein